MPKIFHLVTQNCSEDKNIEIDFTEYEILQLVNLCLKRRYNKQLGVKYAKIYLESKGTEGRKNLINMGVDPNEIEAGYAELKRIMGEIH